MTEIFKVHRNIMAFTKPATVTTQSGTAFTMFLSDHVRQQMGGESTVYFAGEMVGALPRLDLRVADPQWTSGWPFIG